MRNSIIPSYRGIISAEFDLFYYKLLKVKEQALSTRAIAAVKEEDENTITVHGPALAIQDELKTFLENQFERLRRMVVGPSAMYVQDAFYIFVALADEILINLPWQGSDYWRQNCMEIKFFQSQIAGEKIFQQIDYLLKNPDPLQKELSRIYLLCLSLGFLGKYRGQDLITIDSYKQKLFSFIKLRHTRFNSANIPLEIFDGCLDHIFTEAPSKGLPDLKQWGWTAFAIFTFYLFISYGVWSIISYDLHQVLHDLFLLAKQGAVI
jgi:type VI secretion system protein ImpK